MKLILFDIDGTILWTDGAGRRAMEAALLEHFGTTGPASYRYDGKTDAQIVRETMRESGVDDERINRAMMAYWTHTLRGLTPSCRCRSVLRRLTASSSSSTHWSAARSRSALTGNLARGAARKLSAVGVAPERFRLGAYGSDHEHRHELPGIALARAQALGMHFPGDRVIIVGDTPADLQCGRGIGARAIGVATGRYTVDALAAHEPAAVFQDLSDTTAVMRAIDDA
jgi:phosphoglycolate phosphatase-like HAD superfamily hydrolase